MIINKIRFISILCLCAGIFSQNPIDNYLSGNNTLTVIGDIGDGGGMYFGISTGSCSE